MGVEFARTAIIHLAFAAATLVVGAAPLALAQAGASAGEAPIGPPIPAPVRLESDGAASNATLKPHAAPADEAASQSIAEAPLTSADESKTKGADEASADASPPTVAPASHESQPLGAQALGREAPNPAGAVDADASRSSTGMGSIISMRTVGALALVIAIALALKLILSRSLRRSGSLAAHLGPAGRAPSGVLTVLGRYPLGRRQSLVLLKVDRRVLLLALGEAGAHTLTEITDAEDVASILVATRDDEGSSMSRRFHSMLRDFERDPSLSRDEPLREIPMTPRRALHEANEVDDAPAATDAPADPVGSLRRRLASLREASA